VFHDHHFKPRVYYQYDRGEDVVLSVRSGLGVSIMPESMYKLVSHDDVLFFPLSDEEGLRTHVIAWRRKIENPRVQNFLDVIRPCFTQGAGGFQHN
jgi:DNA-binding transcriptional LysR family regulator